MKMAAENIYLVGVFFQICVQHYFSVPTVRYALGFSKLQYFVYFWILKKARLHFQHFQMGKCMTVHIIDLPIKWKCHSMPFFMLFTNIIITSIANSNLSTFWPNLRCICGFWKLLPVSCLALFQRFICQRQYRNETRRRLK